MACGPLDGSGLHASGLQAIAAMLGALVLPVTTWGLFANVRTSKKQAEAASEQVEVANRQINIARDQTQAAHDSVVAANRQSKLLRSQLELELSPFVVFDPEDNHFTNGDAVCSLINKGRGVAVSVRWWYGIGNETSAHHEPLEATSIAPNDSIRWKVSLWRLKNYGDTVTVAYASLDDRQFATFITWKNGGWHQQPWGEYPQARRSDAE